MPLFSGKKDSPPETSATGAPAPGSAPPSELGRLGLLFSEAAEQLADYLAERLGRAPAPSPQLETLAAKLDELRTQLAERGPVASSAQAAPTATGGDSFAPMLESLQNGMNQLQATLQVVHDRSAMAAQSPAGPSGDIAGQLQQQRNELNGALWQLQQRTEAWFQQIAEQLRPQEPEETPGTATAGSADWQQAILGPELVANPALESQRNELIQNVLSGSGAACAFVGQLLVFRSAAAEKMPQLLKEIGEAYYRWQPKRAPGNRPMEEALVAMLHGMCDAAGIPNTLELVHPGERFDSTRHSATTRGVEIVEVQGWIVLRDNGRVYTKATVAVR